MPKNVTVDGKLCIVRKRRRIPGSPEFELLLSIGGDA